MDSEWIEGVSCAKQTKATCTRRTLLRESRVLIVCLLVLACQFLILLGPSPSSPSNLHSCSFLLPLAICSHFLVQFKLTLKGDILSSILYSACILTTAHCHSRFLGCPIIIFTPSLPSPLTQSGYSSMVRVFLPPPPSPLICRVGPPFPFLGRLAMFTTKGGIKTHPLIPVDMCHTSIVRLQSSNPSIFLMYRALFLSRMPCLPQRGCTDTVRLFHSFAPCICRTVDQPAWAGGRV